MIFFLFSKNLSENVPNLKIPTFNYDYFIGKKLRSIQILKAKIFMGKLRGK